MRLKVRVNTLNFTGGKKRELTFLQKEEVRVSRNGLSDDRDKTKV